jgi:hypothetical protein
MNDKYEIFNPLNRPIEDLPTIYGFNNGGSYGWYYGQLIAEDGVALGSHICSSEVYMLGDLGILKGTRPDRHNTFQEHYPDGYKMDFVQHDHTAIKKAYELNQRMSKEEADKGSNAEVEITLTE